MGSALVSPHSSIYVKALASCKSGPYLMCMGKLYAYTKDDDRGLVLVSEKPAVTYADANHMIQLWYPMWESLYKKPWTGDFYALWDGELFVYTEGPPELGSPVEWVPVGRKGIT